MSEDKERISEKEKIMLTKGQNRKTELDSSIDPSHRRPSGSPPRNTEATTGENPSGETVVERNMESR